MIVLGRHRPLAQDAWSESAVRAAIEEIAADAIAQFDPDTFWPAHPSDDGVGDGNPSFYWGASGVIWALDYLHRIGAVSVTEDFRPVLPKLLERTLAAFESFSPTDYAKHGSLLFGDMGTALVAMRLAPTDFPLASDVAQTYYGIKPSRTEDALGAWTNAFNIANDEIEREGVHTHFARIKLNAGRFDEARGHLDAVTNAMYADLKTRLERNLKEKSSATNAAPENLQ